MFLDKLESIWAASSRQNWAAKWIKIGDAQCLLCDLNFKKGAFTEATEAWLSALTAFEVARRLIDEDDELSEEISAKVEFGIQRFGSCLKKVERVKFACVDQGEFEAYFLPGAKSDERSPAVICISREEETRARLLGRLLPVAVGRDISLLVVCHDDFSNHSPGQPENFFSYCVDYLSARSDVDAARIGVYGEGLSAALATDFAVFDHRIAAAVCDGGLWNWTSTVASVSWMAGTADIVDEDVQSIRRLRFARHLKCPVLVVAGGRGMVSASEAMNLQSDCTAARVDLEVAVSPAAQTPRGEIENFVTSDDCIFGWLENKLAAVQIRRHGGRYKGEDLANAVDIRGVP
ncbi:hypothetical protein [Bradyrhizobium sp. CB2312]|uniref:alpha/beta hydrolase family protein n=1 Tax=Bradyrhizobium sp. CB2312 TaxID=3039155 RepID=UPI0024B0BFF7|nr:hypothetical protein [Bradyrhizobium sp. CB2312]WFU71215.1 hypothetical protein QA642_39270 [Bradyrhizobium sp. CB2312]